jgi:hypothetical protein
MHHLDPTKLFDAVEPVIGDTLRGIAAADSGPATTLPPAKV